MKLGSIEKDRQPSVEIMRLLKRQGLPIYPHDMTRKNMGVVGEQQLN